MNWYRSDYMSGFVASIGSSKSEIVESMAERISHRGGYRAGFTKLENGMLYQTYLEADVSEKEGFESVPIRASGEEKIAICYDGRLYADPQSDDRNRSDEERLIDLYRKHGSSLVDHIGEGIFSFLIIHGTRFLIGRDLLGIKTLFYGYREGALYVASELKCLMHLVDEIREFPPGSCMDESGTIRNFARLPGKRPQPTTMSPEHISSDIRRILGSRVEHALERYGNAVSLLSGGLDSSIIAWDVGRVMRERDPASTLSTFSIGTGAGTDRKNARLMADSIESDHHEYVLSESEMIDLLPEVIYYLESFDPSLVRSSIANYVVTREARRNGAAVVFSGEGGDELFCGYAHLADVTPEELYRYQIEAFKSLHNVAALRLDRMNLCHSIQVAAPLISDELLDLALRIPAEYLIAAGDDGRKIEKWIFREAYRDVLPKEIWRRKKQEFSQGSGSADFLSTYFDHEIPDRELDSMRTQFPFLRSKEEMYYLRIFRRTYDDPSAIATVGRWTST